MGIGPFRIGIPELVIILVVVLLIFGPKNLPKLGNAIGKSIKGLRDGMDAGKKQVKEASDEADNDGVEVEEVTEVVEETEDEPAESSEDSEKPAAKTVKKVVVKKA